MSHKQKLLEAARGLPDTANWHEIADVLINVLASAEQPAELARVYRQQITAEQLTEYLDPRTDVSLSSVVAELRSKTS